MLAATRREGEGERDEDGEGRSVERFLNAVVQPNVASAMRRGLRVERDGSTETDSVADVGRRNSQSKDNQKESVTSRSREEIHA